MKKEATLTLVIGASSNPERYAHQAVKLLSEMQLPVVAFGNRSGQINEIDIKTEWSEVVQMDIETVSLYIGPKIQLTYVDRLLDLNPRRVIFNPGTENPSLQQQLHAAGICVEEACTLVLLRTNSF